MVPPTTTQSTPATTQMSQQPSTAKTTQTAAQPAVATGMPEQKKSVFKKWWFWLIVVLVLGGAGVGIWLFLK